jgi:hypothetical protein
MFTSNNEVIGILGSPNVFELSGAARLFLARNRVEAASVPAKGYAFDSYEDLLSVINNR